jgi:hypothetical protein
MKTHACGQAVLRCYFHVSNSIFNLERYQVWIGLSGRILLYETRHWIGREQRPELRYKVWCQLLHVDMSLQGDKNLTST